MNKIPQAEARLTNFKLVAVGKSAITYADASVQKHTALVPSVTLLRMLYDVYNVRKRQNPVPTNLLAPADVHVQVQVDMHMHNCALLQACSCAD